MKFPQRLRELRTERGLKQKELAEKLGVMRYSISDWETGRKQPDYETLLQVSNVFDVSCDYLLGKDS